jgi:hypothetical protein
MYAKHAVPPSASGLCMRRRRRSFFGFPHLANLGSSGHLLRLGVATGPERPGLTMLLGEAAGYGARVLVGLGTGGRVTALWSGDGS